MTSTKRTQNSTETNRDLSTDFGSDYSRDLSTDRSLTADRRFPAVSASMIGLAVGGLALAGLGIYIMRSATARRKISDAGSKVRHYAQAGRDAVVSKVQELRGHGSDVQTQDLGSLSGVGTEDRGRNTVGNLNAQAPDDDFIQGTRPNPLEGVVI